MFIEISLGFGYWCCDSLRCSENIHHYLGNTCSRQNDFVILYLKNMWFTCEFGPSFSHGSSIEFYCLFSVNVLNWITLTYSRSFSSFNIIMGNYCMKGRRIVGKHNLILKQISIVRMARISHFLKKLPIGVL